VFIKGNSIVSKIIFISAIPLLIYGLAFCGLSSLTKWQVHKYVSAEEKESAAQAALMPQVAEYVERQGLRGFQDVDRQVETRLFGSIDELTAAIPVPDCYKASETKSGNDINGMQVTIYEIDKVRPFSGRTSVLPLDFSLIDSDSQKNYWTWTYSIYEYSDGSCRFVMLIRPG